MEQYNRKSRATSRDYRCESMLAYSSQTTPSSGTKRLLEEFHSTVPISYNGYGSMANQQHVIIPIDEEEEEIANESSFISGYMNSNMKSMFEDLLTTRTALVEIRKKAQLVEDYLSSRDELNSETNTERLGVRKTLIVILSASALAVSLGYVLAKTF